MKKKIINILFFATCALLFFILACQLGLIPLRFTYFLSGSMRPVYQPGDLGVVYVGSDLRIQIGDVVLFQTASGPVIHRVIAVDNGQYITKGDANPEPDLQKIKRVDGKVLFGIPLVGYGLQFIQQTIGSLFGR